jgi:DNA recombination protein RmuC
MPVGFQILIAFAIGSGLGWLVGWLLGTRKSAVATPDARVENDLRQQLAQREAELKQTSERLSEAKTAQAVALANQAAAEQKQLEQKQLQEQTLREVKAAQEKSVADLREAFKALSADALKQSAPEFLRLAEQSFGRFQEAAKGDLERRHESIKVLVEPLKQQLESYQKNLQQNSAAQSTTLGEVKMQLELLSQQSASLANETQQFRMVLKSNQTRGKWGEETLRRVVEAAGMSAHCDFTVQAAAGENRPDLVVRLPGERVIIVDAKVPDFDFSGAAEMADPVRRADALAAHAAKLRGTIKALADRDYPREFANALDYVVLFLPAESLFSAALEGDRELIVWAADKRILLATPASLIALLRSVAVSWQQYAQTENAQKIAQAAQELFERVVKFAEHFERIRSGLDRANSAYNDAAASFQARVRPAGERLAELGGASSAKTLPAVPPVEATLHAGLNLELF